MPPIKDIAAIADKWARVVQGRGQDYADGVQNPRTDWKQATIAAAPAQAAGIQAALANKSFEKGVNRVGTAGWQAAAVNKGPRRWQEGVALAVSSYANNFAKYANIIKTTTLPARGPVGDARNIQRVATIADALHKAKVAGT
jgi:hypothetical protein